MGVALWKRTWRTECEGGRRRLFVVGRGGNFLCVRVLSCLAVLCEMQLYEVVVRKKKNVKLKLLQ